ncbi:Flagellar number regulator FleN [Nitrospina gracilis 3/211]|uniref:Flagellar number regulator FleN n=2 Tax=Nitrospinaceae TaxID=407032 RepID=M1YNC0_NITG3|nr:Flagellar number regulator FleN [Nitrospina gracilis 3/211]
MVFSGLTERTGRQANTLRRIMQNDSSKLPPKVLAISSGKGGVGKTNVVANVACALSRKGKKVLIFDADMGLNNIDILLGLASPFHIGHVFSGEKKIEDVLVDGPRGIKVLPASNGWQELTLLDSEKKLLLMEELDRISGDFDYLLFDTGAGISSNVTYFCSAAHDILLVATTEPTSHTDVYALMKVLFQQHHQKRFRLIVNAVKNEREALEVYKRLSTVLDRFLGGVTLEYMGYVVHDANVSKAVRQQKPFIELYPHSKVTQCIELVTQRILKERDRFSPDSDRPFAWRSVLQI